MRSEHLGNNEVYYPDEVCFAFNPILLGIRADSGEFWFTIERKIKGVIQVHNGSGEVDISEYIRACMSVSKPMEDLFQLITIDVGDYVDSTTILTTVVWGAIQPGEVFYPLNQQLTIFRNLPWTVTVFNPSDYYYYLQVDGGKEEQITSDMMYENADLDYYIKPDTETAVVRIDSKAQQQTMSYLYTTIGEFKPIAGDARITLKFDDRTDGVYLRWTDRQGRVLYWLFKRGETTYKIAKEGQEIPDNNRAVYGRMQVQGKKVQASVKVCAYLVDRDTRSLLLSIIGSPFVDMYQGEVNVWANWVPVQVEQSTLSVKEMDLQDLELTITMPETINQMI